MPDPFAVDARASAPQGAAAGHGSGPSLALAGIAALLASTCCVVPLLLAIAGVSGVWIGQLHMMEPYSGALTVLAAVSLLVAAWRIYGPVRQAATPCEDPASCRKDSTAARRWFWAFAALTLLPVLVQHTAHFFY